MMSPSLGSLRTGRPPKRVSSLMAGNFRWQNLPVGSGTLEMKPSAAHRSGLLSKNVSSKSSAAPSALRRVIFSSLVFFLARMPSSDFRFRIFRLNYPWPVFDPEAQIRTELGLKTRQNLD